MPLTYFTRILRENNENSAHACFVREIDLQNLPKGAALNLCHQTVTPLAWCESSSIVKVIHWEILNENAAEQPGQHLQGARARIITDFFYESIHSLVSEHSNAHSGLNVFILLILDHTTQQVMGPLAEDLIAFTLKAVLQGLDYLHSKQIAYGNMSTHSILFSVASGSLEIKLDHTRAVIDDLEARTSEIDKYIQVSGVDISSMHNSMYKVHAFTKYFCRLTSGMSALLLLSLLMVDYPQLILLNQPRLYLVGTQSSSPILFPAAFRKRR